MLLLPAGAWAVEREKVILDTDMVEMFDDGVALLMLAHSPRVELLGVTCVTGNSWVQEGVAYAIRQLELAGKNTIPVYSGMRYPLHPQRHELFAMERKQFGMGHDAWLGSLDLPEPASWE
ncbi:MAG: nucleoside hydrolase, partial [Mailhella sp.]